MFKFKALLEDNALKLAEIISQEHGKVVSDAMGEVTRGLEVVEFACGIPQLLKGEFTEQVGSGIDSHSLRQPLGGGSEGFHQALVVRARLGGGFFQHGKMGVDACFQRKAAEDALAEAVDGGELQAARWAIQYRTE